MIKPYTRRSAIAALCFCALGLCLAFPANALVMAYIREGLYAHLSSQSNGALKLAIGCHVPEGRAPASFYRAILSDPRLVTKYSSVRNVTLPFDSVSPELRRAALLAIFERDWVDEKGWHHVVLYDDPALKETLYTLSNWLTGNGLNWHLIQDENNLSRTQLNVGDYILIPRQVLLPEYQRPTERQPQPPPQPEPEAPTELAPLALDEPSARMETRIESTGELDYGSDAEGEFAIYRLKKGEALYSDVIIRFTDYKDHTDVIYASKKLIERSRIVDPRAIEPGTEIRIPMEMVSDQFKPTTTVARRQYEQSVAASERVREELRREALGRDLDGIVVVLDSGHGSADPGRKDTGLGLYEDEIAYDILCRAKRILENDTNAKVYATILDPDLGYQARDVHQFRHDTDEVILTSPPFPTEPNATKVFLNLRYYLANDIYDREMRNGIEPKHVVFTSFHVDALRESLRGAMIYIPGAEGRSRSPVTNHTNYPYSRHKEVRRYASTAGDRIRDEAWSRAFAQTLYDELGKERVQRHKHGPAIRNIIRQSGGTAYVPAVLRWNKIPTKILLETANMGNATDRVRLADPEWREAVARAYVNALRAHYNQAG